MRRNLSRASEKTPKKIRRQLTSDSKNVSFEKLIDLFEEDLLLHLVCNLPLSVRAVRKRSPQKPRHSLL